jgi:hypothetical protein
MGERRCIGLDSSGRMPCGLQDARASIPVPVAVVLRDRLGLMRLVREMSGQEEARRRQADRCTAPARPYRKPSAAHADR